MSEGVDQRTLLPLDYAFFADARMLKYGTINKGRNPKRLWEPLLSRGLLRDDRDDVKAWLHLGDGRPPNGYPMILRSNAKHQVILAGAQKATDRMAWLKPLVGQQGPRAMRLMRLVAEEGEPDVQVLFVGGAPGTVADMTHCWAQAQHLQQDAGEEDLRNTAAGQEGSGMASSSHLDDDAPSPVQELAEVQKEEEQLPAIKPDPDTVPAAEARYALLAALPFNAEELADLRRNYFEPRMVRTEVASVTSRGTLRFNPKVRKCGPAAQVNYPRLWTHLQQLAQQAEDEAAAAMAAGGAGSSSAGSSGAGINEVGPMPAQVLLLCALRTLQEYERNSASGSELSSRDAVLGRLLPKYGALVAADLADAAEVNTVDNVDMTKVDEVDLETYVIQAVVAGGVRPAAVKLEIEK